MTSTVLKKLYASGGDEIRLATLSFRCYSWAEDVHICQGYDDVEATLETAQTVTFTAGEFAAQLAKRAASGQQSLQFAIDANQSDAMAKVDQALADGAKVYIDYREFLLSDLSAPARPVETLNVINYSYEDPQLIFTASFNDLTNKAWPRRRYTADFAPGLKHYGS